MYFLFFYCKAIMWLKVCVFGIISASPKEEKSAAALNTRRRSQLVWDLHIFTGAYTIHSSLTTAVSVISLPFDQKHLNRAWLSREPHTVAILQTKKWKRSQMFLTLVTYYFHQFKQLFNTTALNRCRASKQSLQY